MSKKSSPPPLDRKESKKRKREILAIIGLGILFVVLTVLEFRLTKVSNTLPFVNSIFFFGILNVNILILIALIWLIFRNIGKLFLERRSRVLGSRLKSKLVVAFLAFSIIPTLVLFLISSSYINSSFDKWFSIKIQNTLQASLEITRTYYRNADRIATHFASHLAEQLDEKLSLKGPSSQEWMSEFLEAQRELLALDAIEFYPDPLTPRVLAKHEQTKDLPYTYPRLSLDLLQRSFRGEKVSTLQHIEKGDVIRCLMPVQGKGGKIHGVIAVSVYIPVSLVNKVDEIASVFDDYKDTNPLRYPIKTTYFVILIMITFVIIVVAIWIGLYMARELTVPVERLVQGAKQVGQGNLDVKIESIGQDEIAVLVKQFNRMTRILRENRERITQATSDSERRRIQLEAVLANIGAGVIVVNKNYVVSTFNRAAAQLLGVEQATGKDYRQLVTGPLEPVKKIIAHAFEHQNDEAQATQWSHSDEGSTEIKTLAAIATTLRDAGSFWGVVVVIDDMTHLIKGQRELAWREVARRIAHEIKNPLTPIKLSAQRLQRRLEDESGNELLRECTNTIVRHADELKEMVNEFSNFARLPEVSPSLNDLNAAIREVVPLFSQAHPNIEFRLEFEKKLPKFEFDCDQIKRVLINLINNAVAAIEAAKKKGGIISIDSRYNESLKIAVLLIRDNGPGMTDEVRDRVFEPYFSTKGEGTGLGLAIVKRVINDHDGFVRVHSKPHIGTEFVIELPTAPRASAEIKMGKDRIKKDVAVRPHR